MGQMVRETHNGATWSNFYGEPEMMTISSEHLNELLRAEIVLQALMLGGVHNWSGFEKAMLKAESLLK